MTMKMGIFQKFHLIMKLLSLCHFIMILSNHNKILRI